MEPEEIPVVWDRYRGNNFHRFPRLKVVRGGSVSFARHLGKPLSDGLWVDLVHRLCVSGLCVYGPDDEQWTIDRMG